MKIKIFILVVLCFVYTGNNLKAEISDAGDYLKKNVKTRKLKNGITLIMLNRGFAPTLAFEISFKVGSSDESYRTAGAAHLLEHMLFKGTDKVGTKNYKEEKKVLDRIEAVGETLDKLKLRNPNNVMIPKLEKELKELQKKLRKYVINSPYDKIYSANGGVGFNASTSRDRTGYYIQLPSDRIELWAKTESERLRNPVLREYYLERNNVIQERLMRYDSKGTGLLYEKFLANAFTSHPYRHPIIGWRSNIPYLSIKDIRKFYRQNYIPSKMTITIVGKQDIRKTYDVIEKYFGKIKPKKEPGENIIKELPQGGEKRFELYFKSNPALTIGWHKPTYPNKEDYICDVISDILSSGKSSRLYKSLVLEKKLVSSIDSWNGSPGARYDNLFVIFAEPTLSSSLEQVEKEIYLEIEKLYKTISKKEIQKVVNKIESDMIFGITSNKGISSFLSYYQTVFDDWKYSITYLEQIKKISIKDVKRVIKNYFKSNNRVVGILRDSRKKGEEK